jgi:hypothetical protein
LSERRCAGLRLSIPRGSLLLSEKPWQILLGEFSSTVPEDSNLHANYFSNLLL